MPLRNAIRRARILVVGDVMLDRYWHRLPLEEKAPDVPAAPYAAARRALTRVWGAVMHAGREPPSL